MLPNMSGCFKLKSVRGISRQKFAHIRALIEIVLVDSGY